MSLLEVGLSVFAAVCLVAAVWSWRRADREAKSAAEMRAKGADHSGRGRALAQALSVDRVDVTLVVRPAWEIFWRDSYGDPHGVCVRETFAPFDQLVSRARRLLEDAAKASRPRRALPAPPPLTALPALVELPTLPPLPASDSIPPSETQECAPQRAQQLEGASWVPGA